MLEKKVKVNENPYFSDSKNKSKIESEITIQLVFAGIKEQPQNLLKAIEAIESASVQSE